MEHNRIFPSVDPDVITNLTTSNITTTSITLLWQTPDGNVSFYLIEMPGLFTVYYEASTNVSVIENLTPGNLYSFRVYAVVGVPNVLGNGSNISAYTSKYFLSLSYTLLAYFLCILTIYRQKIV